MSKTVAFLSILLISIVSWAQSDERPQLLVLGTYHMANPGRDLADVQADDVLSPKRHQEIAQLIDVLKRFHPTKIAIEAEFGSRRVEQEYSDYLAGKYKLSRNETNQIGYRLAKELGHRSVYAVDIGGEFPWQRLVNYAKANGLADKPDAIMASASARAKEQNEFLRSHTVLEMLTYMNSDSVVAKDVAWYYACVPLGDPFDNAGPDLVALWFQRNIRIYNNILKLIESANERILVIYGAGHLGWLQQDIANDPTVKLRKLIDLTGLRSR